MLEDKNEAWAPQIGPAPTRTRVVKLTVDQAVAIFLARLTIPTLTNPRCKFAKKLAVEFRISSKAIRDVWNRKTWAEETRCVCLCVFECVRVPQYAAFEDLIEQQSAWND